MSSPRPSDSLECPRILFVVHAHLKNGRDNLNYDLFTNHLKLFSTCEKCGHEKEDAEHFFMQCPSYLNDRVLFLSFFGSPSFPLRLPPFSLIPISNLR